MACALIPQGNARQPPTSLLIQAHFPLPIWRHVFTRFPDGNPTVRRPPPDSDKIMPYDQRHFVTYLRLLDAATGIDWREITRIVCGLDPKQSVALWSMRPSWHAMDDGEGVSGIAPRAVGPYQATGERSVHQQYGTPPAQRGSCRAAFAGAGPCCQHAHRSDWKALARYARRLVLTLHLVDIAEKVPGAVIPSEMARSISRVS